MPSWLPCQDGMQAINCKQKWTVPPRRWFLLDQSNENCNWYNSGCRKVSLQTGVKMVSAKKEKRKKKASLSNIPTQYINMKAQRTVNGRWDVSVPLPLTILSLWEPVQLLNIVYFDSYGSRWCITIFSLKGNLSHSLHYIFGTILKLDVDEKNIYSLQKWLFSSRKMGLERWLNN